MLLFIPPPVVAPLAPTLVSVALPYLPVLLPALVLLVDLFFPSGLADESKALSLYDPAGDTVSESSPPPFKGGQCEILYQIRYWFGNDGVIQGGGLMNGGYGIRGPILYMGVADSNPFFPACFAGNPPQWYYGGTNFSPWAYGIPIIKVVIEGADPSTDVCGDPPGSSEGEKAPKKIAPIDAPIPKPSIAPIPSTAPIDAPVPKPSIAPIPSTAPIDAPVPVKPIAPIDTPIPAKPVVDSPVVDSPKVDKPVPGLDKSLPPPKDKFPTIKPKPDPEPSEYPKDKPPPTECEKAKDCDPCSSSTPPLKIAWIINVNTVPDSATMSFHAKGDTRIVNAGYYRVVSSLGIPYAKEEPIRLMQSIVVTAANESVTITPNKGYDIDIIPTPIT